MNHKWVKIEEPEFVCKNCGIRKKNIWMGYGKNGHAALYFLKNGERTSYKPDCVPQLFTEQLNTQK